MITGSALKTGSVRPSVCLSGFFLGIGSSVFSKFWHGIKNPYEVMLDKAGFSEKNGENTSKIEFFELIETFGH